MSSIRDTSLDDMQFINCLASSVQWTPEDRGTDVEVVKINESENFAFIMGLYRGSCEKTHYTFNPLKQSKGDTHEIANNSDGKTLGNIDIDIGSSSSSECCSPALQLILAAAAIRRCGPYYGAWKARRDIVMDPKRFTACCHEESTFLLRFDVSNSSWLDVLEYYRGHYTGMRRNNNNKTSNNSDLHSSSTVHAQVFLDPCATNVLGVTRLAAPSPLNISEAQDERAEVHDVLADVALVRVSDWGEHKARQMAKALLPSKYNDFLKPSTDASQDYSYCPIHAVKWELDQTRSFAVKNHKNFQVWHHRQELLAFALSKIYVLSGDANSINEGKTEDNCNEKSQYFDAAEKYFYGGPIIGNVDKGTESNKNTNKSNGNNHVRFSMIDERDLCDEVLESDSKNYHVWSHRCWFVATFRFLHTYDVIRTINSISDRRGVNKELFFVPSLLNGVATPLNKRTNAKGITCLLAPSPNNTNDQNDLTTLSNLQSELNYSSKVIEEDVFNNSGWSYRMMLVKSYVIPPIIYELKRLEKEGATLSSSYLSLFRFLVEDILVAEIEYALSYGGVEVCNECPFTYAIGICALATAVESDGSYRTTAMINQWDENSNDEFTKCGTVSREQKVLYAEGDGESIVLTSCPYYYFPCPLQMLLTTAVLHSLEIDIFPVAESVERDIIQSISDAIHYARGEQTSLGKVPAIEKSGKERNEEDVSLQSPQEWCSTLHGTVPPSEISNAINIVSHVTRSKYAKRCHFVKDNIHQPLAGYYHGLLSQLRCMMAETQMMGNNSYAGVVNIVRDAIKQVATAQELIKLFSVLTLTSSSGIEMEKEHSTPLICGVKSSILLTLPPVQELIDKVTYKASEIAKRKCTIITVCDNRSTLADDDMTDVSCGVVPRSVFLSLTSSILVTLVGCLKTARQLYDKDTIRLKYWRLQIKMLLHYEFC